MKRKLLIVVGAGASIEFGMPSVVAVDTLLDAHAAQLFPLAADPSSNLYRYCRDTIEAYYAQCKSPAIRKSVNFEEVIYQLNLLAPCLSDGDFQHGANALLTPSPWPDVLQFGRHRAVVDKHVLHTLSASLLDAIAEDFIVKCGALMSSKASEIGQLGQFLSALSDEFEVGIVTMNYDNVIELACPGMHSGFDDTGEFDSESVLMRKDWGFLYHMHGSVNFAMTGNASNMHGITWTDTPSHSSETQSFGRSSQSSMEGTDFPTSTIIAGYGKPQQIQRQPFLAYYSQLSRLVREADSLLFLGYGFGDLHLNSAFSEVRGKRRPAVVIDYASDTADCLAHRHDSWSYNLGKTLPLGVKGWPSAHGHIAPWAVSELKAAKEFEVTRDPDAPLAIWYNGFLAACREPDKVLLRLI